jgi:hypothetical protein
MGRGVDNVSMAGKIEKKERRTLLLEMVGPGEEREANW